MPNIAEVQIKPPLKRMRLPAQLGITISTNPAAIASVLRSEHIPFDVVPSRSLKDVKTDALVLATVERLTDEEMEVVECFVKNGGNLYISGKPGHTRLFEMLEAEYLGETEHDATYMNPTKSGLRFFVGFSAEAPLSVLSPHAPLRFGGEYEARQR